MVQKHAHGSDRGLLSRVRTNGFVAWHRAALHPLWPIHGDAALRVPHILKLEKGAPLLARRPSVNALAVFITFNAVCFGLLIFSGHIGATSNAQRTSQKLSMLKNVP